MSDLIIPSVAESKPEDELIKLVASEIKLEDPTDEEGELAISQNVLDK